MSTDELVGRHDELRRLDEMVDALPAQGSAALLEGEPGIGKSSLLRVAAQRARRRGCLLLQTAGVESEEQLAFAGLQLLLDPVTADSRALPEAQGRALASTLR